MTASVRPPSIAPSSNQASELRSRFDSTSVAAGDVEQREHAENVLRLRQLLVVGIALWFFAGMLIDWNVCRIRPGTSLTEHFAVRVLSTATFLLVLRRLYAAPLPSIRVFAALELTTFVTAGIGTAFFAMRNGGTSSPSMHFIMPILVTQGISIPRHWKQGIGFSFATFAAGPIALLLFSIVFPKLRAQFGHPDELSQFTIECVMLATAATLVVLGGHFVWTLRREIYSTRQVGRYRLKERIGSGGMGEVWLGTHSSLKRDVAIKLLRGRRGESDRDLEQFNREVDALAGLTHPNTVRVYDRGVTEEGISFFAMEYVRGETVHALVERSGPLPVARALKIIVQVSRALAEAHAKSIVHRDINPKNVLVTELGGEKDFVKVIDFGIAKILEDSGPLAQSSIRGAPRGSPAFMPPERLLGETGDARSDVYAIGAVCYFMLAGRAPREVHSTTAAIHEASSAISPLPLASDGAEAAINEVVMQCLAGDAARRFADAKQLARAFVQAQAS